jgi:hypothetical protein
MSAKRDARKYAEECAENVDSQIHMRSIVVIHRTDQFRESVINGALRK